VLHALGLREIAKFIHPIVDSGDDTPGHSASQYLRTNLRNMTFRKLI
jgi:hypothetical protein